MANLEHAIENLKACLSRVKVEKKDCVRAIDEVSSRLTLLKSLSISSLSAQVLAKQLRRTLIALYIALPQPTLQFAAALSRVLYEDKVLVEYTAGKHEQKALWESVLNALLSGVLDYLDKHPSDESKEAVGSTLYHALCSAAFSLSITGTCIDLRCTAYTLLSETAAGHRGNQKRLRDLTYLGGVKLGALIWRTKDYLVLECLLDLFARILPSAHGSSNGRKHRAAFIRSVFISTTEEHVKTGEELATMLENAPTSDWEHTAMKIVEKLAASSITFPQPFDVSDVLACGHLKRSDRLYVDHKGFLANLPLDDNQFESLNVPYSSIHKIEITSGSSSTAGAGVTSFAVVVDLTTPPTVGKEPVTPKHDGGTSAHLAIVFDLKKDDISRFRHALKSRSLDKFVKVLKPSKLSLAESSANLEINARGDLVAAELEQRVENLSQLYGTNEPSDDAHEAPIPGIEDSAVTAASLKEPSPGGTSSAGGGFGRKLSTPKGPVAIDAGPKPKKSRSTVSKVLSSSPTRVTRSRTRSNTAAATGAGEAVTHVEKSMKKSGQPVSLQLTTTQATRNAIFGASDEELSEIDDIPERVALSDSAVSSKQEMTYSKIVPASVKGIKVIVFDDETSQPATSTRVTRSEGKKKKAINISDDDIEDVLPIWENSDMFVATRRSSLLMTPVTPPKLRSSAIAQVASRNTSQMPAEPSVAFEKPDADSDAADPTFPLTTLPSLELSGRGTSKTGLNRAPPPGNVPRLDGSNVPGIDQNRDVVVSHIHSPPASSTPAKTVTKTSELIVRTPSPVTVSGVDVKPVKARLRKKDGLSSALGNIESRVRVKRKRDDIAEGENSACTVDEELGHPIAKRTRSKDGTQSEAQDAVVPEITESQVLKPRTTAATRATKRYRGKKGRTSSPISPSPPRIDYDDVPDKSPVPNELSSASRKRDGKKSPPKKTVVETSGAIAKRTRAAAMKGKEQKSAASTGDETKTSKQTPKLVSMDEKACNRDVGRASAPVEQDQAKPHQTIEPVEPTVVQKPKSKKVRALPSKAEDLIESTLVTLVTTEDRNSLNVLKNDQEKTDTVQKETTNPLGPKKSNKAPWDALSPTALTSEQADCIQNRAGPTNVTLESGADAEDVDWLVPDYPLSHLADDVVFVRSAMQCEAVEEEPMILSPAILPAMLASPVVGTDIAGARKTDIKEVKIIRSSPMQHEAIGEESMATSPMVIPGEPTSAVFESDMIESQKNDFNNMEVVAPSAAQREPVGEEPVTLSPVTGLDSLLFTVLEDDNVHSRDDNIKAVEVVAAAQLAPERPKSALAPLKFRDSATSATQITPERPKASFAPLKAVCQDAEMIDLTLDSPAKQPALKQSALKQTTLKWRSPLVTARHEERPPLIEAIRPRHAVSFAPVVEEREISPPFFDSDFLNSRASRIVPRTTMKMSGSSGQDNKTERGRPGETRHRQEDRQSVSRERERTKREPGMEAIIDVLDKIQDVVMHRITSKIEGVKSNVQAGRTRLLADATSDLLDMQTESIHHFNRLIDFESEYATFGRNVTHGLEDLAKANEYVCKDLRKIIESHDRNILSKRTTGSLFSSPIPASISKFLS